jgi:hypothetical protein
MWNENGTSYMINFRRTTLGVRHLERKTPGSSMRKIPLKRASRLFKRVVLRWIRTELAEVKAILDHINNARAKLPCCLGMIRYKGKPRRM